MADLPLYPVELFEPHPYHPTSRDLEVRDMGGALGKAVIANRRYASNSMIAKFSGVVVHTVLQHTLQMAPGLHLHDPWFIGNLSHSYSPNVFLDMNTFEIWTADISIAAGDVLAMDYSSTEDRLFRQFVDHATKRIVHGRKEQPDPYLLKQVSPVSRSTGINARADGFPYG